jgi:hypothetical protein
MLATLGEKITEVRKENEYCYNHSDDRADKNGAGHGIFDGSDYVMVLRMKNVEDFFNSSIDYLDCKNHNDSHK